MANPYEKTADSHALTQIGKSVVSPAITIVINGVTMGYIQSLTETQSRPANPIHEVGSTGRIELVPGQPAYNLTANKVAIYKYNLLRIFAGQGVQENDLYETIKSKLQEVGVNEATSAWSVIVEMPIPFNIQVFETDPFDDSVSVTKYIDCFITNYTRPIDATGNLTITETCNIEVRDILNG